MSRRHEGVDIFAKKGTPALAAADGYVTRVNENNLGGKVVFLMQALKTTDLGNSILMSVEYVPQNTQSVKEGNLFNVFCLMNDFCFSIYVEQE